MEVERHDQVLAATSHLLSVGVFARHPGGGRSAFRYCDTLPAVSALHRIALGRSCGVTFTTNARRCCNRPVSSGLAALRAEVDAGNGRTVMPARLWAKPRDFFTDLQEKPVSQTGPSRLHNANAMQAKSVPGDKPCRTIQYVGRFAGGTTRDGFLEGLCTGHLADETWASRLKGLEGKVTIQGVGLNGLKAPKDRLWMGNRHPIRLMSGLLRANPLMCA